MSDPVETKLSAARTRLILDKPFLGALVLRLPMVEAGEWCKTTATDVKTFYYNKQYVEALTLDETQFVLAHEALHCALLHFARRQHREKHRWDLACDFAINPLLISDGLKPPANALVMEEYEGMTAEEIYPLIDDQLDQEPMDQHLFDPDEDSDSDGDASGDQSGMDEKDYRDKQDSGSNEGQQNKGGSSSNEGKQQETQESDSSQGKAQSQPQPLNENEKAQLSVQWQQRMAGAAQTAMQAGKLGGSIARMVDHLLQPQLPWRMLLARYMTSVARDDYNYMRPSSRRESSGAVFPSLRSTQIDLLVLLDTSGSITDSELDEFISEVNAIKGQMRARITLHACDSELSEAGPWTYEAWEEIELPDDIHGGGGTDFCPAFEWISTRDQHPDLVVYFTDALGSFPEKEPDCPVIWLVKGKTQVPWGQRIQLN
jgi:predicted metal-dependent peptidase